MHVVLVGIPCPMKLGRVLWRWMYDHIAHTHPLRSAYVPLGVYEISQSAIINFNIPGIQKTVPDA